MSKSFQMDEQAKQLVKLLNGLQIDVKKINQNTKVGKAKILTYKKGYIQYMSKDEFIARQKSQPRSTLYQEDYIYNHGYLVYKAGVNINVFKNGENQIEFGWNNAQKTEYYFIFRFKLKHKIIYNPAPDIQKKQKKKREKNPQKDVIWRFEVQLESEIIQIQKRLNQIEENNKRLEKLKFCDSFAYKFDQMEIEIWDSETLLQELKIFNIEIEFLGHIFNKLENNTNRNIVSADIAARSLFLYMSNLDEYKLKEFKMIEEMIKALYQDKRRNFNQEVIEIAQKKFESNLEASNFVITDALFLNALMFHFQFTIDLDVRRLLDYGSFFSSIKFNTLSENIIKFSTLEPDVPNEPIEMKQMNYLNFLQFQRNTENEEDIKNYCIALFGEENQYLGIYYLALYKQYNKKKYLDLAQTLFEKHLKNSHPLLKSAFILPESIPNNIQQPSQHICTMNPQQALSNQQQSHIQKSSEKPNTQISESQAKKTIKIIEVGLINDNQHDVSLSSFSNQQQILFNQLQIIDRLNSVAKQEQEKLDLILFNGSTAVSISESHWSADKLSFQIAEENYQKEHYVSALKAIDDISNKTKMVLKLGFQIERKLNVPINQYYANRLLKNYIIYGCDVQDLQDIEEILELQFKQYMQQNKISFQSDEWKHIITKLNSRKLSKERFLIADSIVMDIRYYKYDDIKIYFNRLIEQLKDFQQDQIDKYYDQFQLIYKIYLSSQKL